MVEGETYHMKNIMVGKDEFAAECCIVCDRVPTPQDGFEWSYYAGALPIGSMTCSKECHAVAMKRFERTKRLDTRTQRYSVE